MPRFLNGHVEKAAFPSSVGPALAVTLLKSRGLPEATSRTMSLAARGHRRAHNSPQLRSVSVSVSVPPLLPAAGAPVGDPPAAPPVGLDTPRAGSLVPVLAAGVKVALG